MKHLRAVFSILMLGCLIFLAPPAFAASTYTEDFGQELPGQGDVGWDDAYRESMRIHEVLQKADMNGAFVVSGVSPDAGATGLEFTWTAGTVEMYGRTYTVDAGSIDLTDNTSIVWLTAEPLSSDETESGATVYETDGEENSPSGAAGYVVPIAFAKTEAGNITQLKDVRSFGPKLASAIIPRENLLSNSGLSVWSNSALANVGDQISVTNIAAGVCTTADTEGLAIGKLVKFGAGGTTANKVYEVTAVTTNTNFTIHNTTITDATAVTCYEVTPGCIAADALAADGHSKTSTLDVYRAEAASTYISEYYGLKAVKGADTAEYYNLNAISDLAFLGRFKGRTVTLAAEIYSVGAADNVKLQIYDGVGTTESAFVAADTKTWVEITRTIDASATQFTPRILFDGDTADVAYVNRVIAVFGPVIGRGNYTRPKGEIVWFETVSPSNLLHNTLNLSSVAATTISVEADSNGAIPKSAAALYVTSSVNDLASAATNVNLLYLRGFSAGILCYANSVAGLANDARNFVSGWAKCSISGDIDYIITASGANAFDVNIFRYLGVELR